MRPYNANLYADHIENLLNETPTPFLDVDELSYLMHLSDKALLHYLNHKTGLGLDVPFMISEYATAFKDQENSPSPLVVRQFAFWISLFEFSPSFTEKEKESVRNMGLQCRKFALQSAQVTSADEDEDFTEFGFEKRMLHFKGVQELAKKCSADIRASLVSSYPDEAYDEWFDALCEAYKEGMETLSIPENISALNTLMTATRVDDKHDEFFITGEHRKNVHHNRDMQRGFTKPGGLKSTKPIYTENENTIFHSHPSLSPLSLNVKEDFYNPKNKIMGGDLGHVTSLNKNAFAINKNGDIFYSNPRLANVCLYNLKGCLPDDGQVYLGNIQDFIK